MILHCPASLGEVVDKLTILRIKCEKISDPAKLVHAQKERQALETLLASIQLHTRALEAGAKALEQVNRQLWDVEDQLREFELRGDFGEGFVALARSVYKLNDQRFSLKNKVNQELGSGLIEVKSYKGS